MAVILKKMKNRYISATVCPIVMLYTSCGVFPRKNMPWGLVDIAAHLGG